MFITNIDIRLFQYISISFFARFPLYAPERCRCCFRGHGGEEQHLTDIFKIDIRTIVTNNLYSMCICGFVYGARMDSFEWPSRVHYCRRFTLYARCCGAFCLHANNASCTFYSYSVHRRYVCNSYVIFLLFRGPNHQFVFACRDSEFVPLPIDSASYNHLMQ
jgi:hypothetical protein